VLFALLYFVLLRPNKRRQQQALRARNTYDLGDEVVAGGMVGRVVRLGDGEVDVEVSDGVVVQFVPQAVQLKSAYLAGPRGRGLGGGGGMGGGLGGGMGGGLGASRNSGASGSTGYSSAADDSSATGGTVTGARSRSVRRRAGASSSWPDVNDSPVAGDDIVIDNGTGGDNGPGPSAGGGAPSSGGN
jgi:preprotein translocase subunit YajC